MRNCGASSTAGTDAAAMSVAGGCWPARARAAAQVTTKDDESTRTLLLSDVFDIFAAKSAEFISSSDLVAALLAMEGRPWAEWKNGKPITTHGLARMLAPFKVFPARVSSGSGYRL